MDQGQNSERRCLLIAPLENHATAGRVAALAATGYAITVADVSIGNVPAEDCYPFDAIRRVHDVRASQQDPIYASTGRARAFSLLTDWLRSYRIFPESRKLTGALREAIREGNPEVVVTFYGPIAIHYARIVKRIAPRLPVVIILNLLPSTIVARTNPVATRLRKLMANEFADYRNWLHELDAIVFASDEMKTFVRKKFGNTPPMALVAPDYLPRTFQGSVQEDDAAAALPNDNAAREPSVIFLGAPERYGGVLDSPDEQFLQLANSGIHVYSGSMSDRALENPRCHVYSRFSNEAVFSGRLAEFARGFDAAIITYNVRGRHERFRSTYPTRFFTALTAGIPIAVKGGVFDACERFVAEHGNGFVYNSVTELKETLLDRARMAGYRQRAREVMRTTTAETQGAAVRAFLDQVIAASSTGAKADGEHLNHR